MLYLEGFFRSAEIEYWSCIAILHGALLLDTSTTSRSVSFTEAEVAYIRSLYACSLLNIAVARAHQPNAVKTSRQAVASVRQCSPESQDSSALLSHLLDLSDAIVLSPPELCDYSLRLRNDKVGVMRKFLVLEKLKMYE
jgi:hypothetical protein